MEDLYDEGYWEHGHGSNYHNYGDDPGWKGTVKVLTQFVPPRATLFETASAKGYFLKEAQEAGYDTVGIDLSEYAVSKAVVPVIHADAADPSWVEPLLKDRGGFDIVCSWEFLEHVPHENLCDVVNNMLALPKDGALFVHRIGITTVEGVRLDNDHTHVSNHTYGWWENFLESFNDFDWGFTLTKAPEVVEALDKEFKGRDWSGRFFAYWVSSRY